MNIPTVEEFDEQIEQLRERGITITHINKQETLEEVAESYVKNFAPSVKSAREIGFIDGAKYQAKRMYSEEETIQLLIKFNQEIQEVEDVRIWFEKFKKK